MSATTLKNVVGVMGKNVAKVATFLGQQPDDNSDAGPNPDEEVAIEDHVYLAFLKASVMQDEPNWRYRLASWLKSWATGGDVIHVETWFVRKGVRYNVSVDSVEMKVFATKDKKYSREGWIMMALPMDHANIMRMQKWATQQLGKPYNANVYCDFAFVTPYEDEDTSFTCSQLATRILQQGGLFTGYDARYVTDVMLFELVEGMSNTKINPVLDYRINRVVEAQPGEDSFAQYQGRVV